MFPVAITPPTGPCLSLSLSHKPVRLVRRDKTVQETTKFGLWKERDPFMMKNILLVFLAIAVVLLVTVESRKFRKVGVGKGKGGNRKPFRRECPSNCSNCGLAGRCLECDDGFAKITISKRANKTICIPCSQQKRRKKGPDRDNSKCPPGPTTIPPCPKNCSDCKDGDCLVCDSGFALVSLRKNKTICITCASRRNGKKVDRSQCDPETCGKGCLNCTEGVCGECKDGFKMLPNKNKCKKKKDCGRGCLKCLSGVCSKCKDGLTLNPSSKRCVKPCTAADPDSKTPACKGKGKGKEGKNKRKGGKGKPKRRPTPYPKS